MEQAELERLYAAMLRIRRFEDTVHLLFLQNEIEGTTHLCQGQEAVSVGVCDVLEPGDTVAATYRGHGACLAQGLDPPRLFAELLGRETGPNGGRGGSMNVVDLEHGVIGCFGIVGGSIGAGTGAALAAQLSGDGTVAVAFFGDGAVEPGVLPRVPQPRGRSPAADRVRLREQPVRRVDGHGAGDRRRAHHAAGGRVRHPGLEVDGNDVLAVREAAQEAVTRAREGGGPTFLEFRTYRHKGHSRVDPGKYRPKEEVEAWLARDPLPRLAELLDAASAERIDRSRRARDRDGARGRPRGGFPGSEPARERDQGRPDARAQLPGGRA